MTGEGLHETGERRMTEPGPLPRESLHCVLAHLETERMLHEKEDDDKRFDAVYEHASKLREWLSGVDDDEPGGATIADSSEAHASSEMPAS
jgi:hypothetical protein